MKIALWITAYCILFIAFGISYLYYGPVAPLLWLVLIAISAAALRKGNAPSDRALHMMSRIKQGTTTVCAGVGLLWLLSIGAYVRIPTGAGKAWAVGGGNVIRHTGVGSDGKPLTPTANWAWSGLTAGGFGMAIATWGNGKTSSQEYWAIWPSLVILMIPTTILWLLRPDPAAAGLCDNCGYNLTGNVSGVCPECGKEIEGRRQDGVRPSDVGKDAS